MISNRVWWAYGPNQGYKTILIYIPSILINVHFEMYSKLHTIDPMNLWHELWFQSLVWNNYFTFLLILQNIKYDKGLVKMKWKYA
jgi:hypothetical protein